MYIYGELFKPDKLIPFCVWIKLENWMTGGSKGDINFDYSKSLNTCLRES